MKSENVHNLPKDTFYYKDLICCKVYLFNEELYGEVIDITSNGKQDVLRIKLLNNKAGKNYERIVITRKGC